MKPNIPNILIGLLGCLIFNLLSPITATAVPEDAILAVVNNDVITYRDLAEYLKSRYSQLRLEGIPESKIRSMMTDLETNGIQRLIQDRLVIHEAELKKIEIRKQAVDDRIAQIQKNYPSEAVFLKALAEDGLSLSDLRKKIEDQLKVQNVIDTEVRNKIYINPQEITDYYMRNLAQYQTPERINLDSIFVSKAKDPGKAKAKADEALAKIKAGEDFRLTAEGYSETPALGTVAKGTLLPQIENAVGTLAPGQISDLVEVENGYYIFKLLGKIDARTASLEDVKNSIQKIIYDRKLGNELNKWLDHLEKKAFVEVKENDFKGVRQQ